MRVRRPSRRRVGRPALDVERLVRARHVEHRTDGNAADFAQHGPERRRRSRAAPLSHRVRHDERRLEGEEARAEVVEEIHERRRRRVVVLGRHDDVRLGRPQSRREPVERLGRARIGKVRLLEQRERLDDRVDDVDGMPAARHFGRDERADARAEPKLRVFMEPGADDADAQRPPDADDPTLCLDVYPADETPGLSAVVKGRPAPTVVLWRAHRNVLTHAWLAPDRDGFATDWAAVTEDSLLNATKLMTHVNAVLTDHLPASKTYWDFHFNNYEVDVDVI
mmetsp:Transcript_6139/g.25724  ORF Transcript_6139/g.25724 Transcript_6139/m.25724 type:complete len:280 (-) Transcript_6139:1214-2053(-)